MKVYKAIKARFDQERKIIMGIVVCVSAYGEWRRTYFVQTLDEFEAKEKAYEMSKMIFNCNLPDTLDEAEENESIIIEIITEVETIIF